MVKYIVPAIASVILLASCSTFKPLNFTSNKQVSNSPAVKNEYPEAPASKKEVKFINNISAQASASSNQAESAPVQTFNTRGFNIEETKPKVSGTTERTSALESASAVRLKYSVLLNTEVEQLQNEVLLESVDEWYGTRYRLGGTTKKGIDCSAFVQAVYAAAFSIAVPRTAREQYRACRKVSRTELKEGDLLFFNTTGGVSHVGIYLQNNKFIHASASKGVTVSDMFEPYYLKRYVGAGRVPASMGAR